MMKRQTPPGTKANSWVVVVKPVGPNRSCRCFTSLQIAQASSRGASRRREKTTSQSDGRSTRDLAMPGIPAAYRPQSAVKDRPFS
jgi:hypothetical protein